MVSTWKSFGSDLEFTWQSLGNFMELIWKIDGNKFVFLDMSVIFYAKIVFGAIEYGYQKLFFLGGIT